MTKKSSKLALWRFFFWVYIAIMLGLLFGRSFGWNDNLSYKEMLLLNMNTTPLYTIRNYLHVIFGRTNDSVFVHCLVNLAGNVILFIPIGVLIPKLWKKYRNFFKFFFIALLAILTIEFVQLFTLLGCCDIDDVILNMTGLTIGYIIWAIFK